MRNQHPDNQQEAQGNGIEMTDLAEHLDEVNRVASEYLKGKNETAISQELAIPRSRVVVLVKEWKQMASNSDAVRVRAREALSSADQHYSQLIKEAYDVLEDAKDQESLGSRLGAIKLVTDIEKSRIEMLQKAGLLENRELAEKMMETEAKQAAIMGIIKEVVSDCAHCKPKVLARMAGIGKEPTVIYES